LNADAVHGLYLTILEAQDVLAQLAQFEKIARAKSDDHASRSEFYRGKAEGFRRSIDVVRELVEQQWKAWVRSDDVTLSLFSTYSSVAQDRAEKLRANRISLRRVLVKALEHAERLACKADRSPETMNDVVRLARELANWPEEAAR
jgi:hypothetical protein